jgi:hypothetical protein
LRGLATNGVFPSITSGVTAIGTPVISLSDNSKAAKHVRMSVLITPVMSLQTIEAVTLVITVFGAALACHSNNGCAFSGPNPIDHPIVKFVSSNTFDSVISVTFTNSSILPSYVEATTQNFSFFIDGVSILSDVQPVVRDIRASFVDALGQVRALMLGGVFPAIVSFSRLRLFFMLFALCISFILFFRFAPQDFSSD